MLEAVIDKTHLTAALGTKNTRRIGEFQEGSQSWQEPQGYNCRQAPWWTDVQSIKIRINNPEKKKKKELMLSNCGAVEES